MGVRVERRKWKSSNGRTYVSILLRHSYREGGKVLKRTIANLTHCPPEDVAAIELALQHKDELAALFPASVSQGRSKARETVRHRKVSSRHNQL